MRPQKSLALFAVVIAAVLALSACTSSSTAKPIVHPATTFAAGTTMAKLHDAKAMTIGTRFDQPLFGLVGADKIPTGFDAEIGKLIASKLGIASNKITWVEAVPSNQDSLIVDGKANVLVTTYSINDASKDVISFAGPYFVAGQDILVAAGNPGHVTGPESLRGKNVCSAAGSSYAAVIAEYGVNLASAGSAADCVAQLDAGKVIAVTDGDVILAGLAAQSAGKHEVIGAPFTADPQGIALAHDDTKFRSFINDVLEESFADGTWTKLWNATAGTVLKSAKPPMVDRY